MERPSYDLKIDWAEKHLVNLEWEIRSYCDTHPYEVRVRKRKSQGRSYTLRFTRQPGDHLALMAGDFLYNIRAAYDHVACAMVPNKYRKRVHFPVFFQGVWDPPVGGEDEQRAQARCDWLTYTEHMPDEAVAILKLAQPPDPTLDEHAWFMHGIGMMNRLRNADAHRKLSVVGNALTDVVVSCETPHGPFASERHAGLGPNDALTDGAEIHGIPEGAMNVKLDGALLVVLRVGEMKGGFELPAVFREQVLEVARAAISALRPYTLPV